MITDATVERLMVLTSTSVAASESFEALLNPFRDRLVDVFCVRSHSPAATVEEAVHRAKSAEVDGLLAVGGGATADTAKLVCARLAGLPPLDTLNLERDLAFHLEAGEALPVFALPTIMSGAAFNFDASFVFDRQKHVLRHQALLARAVILDADITATSPRVFARSAFTPISHCVAVLRSPFAHPIAVALARQGLDTLLIGLGDLVRDDDDLDARQDLLGGEWLAALARVNVKLIGVLHIACQVLGAFSLRPHSELHAVMLPPILALPALNASAEDARFELTKKGGRDEFLNEYVELRAALGIPTRLRELGIRYEALASIASAVATHPQVTALQLGKPNLVVLEELFYGAW